MGHNREGLPWVEKYRPSDLDEILAHEEIISTIRTLITKSKLPHLLFYGPPGTGKTTTVLACARMLYGPNFHNYVMELNASDDRGIDIVRNQIKDFASTKQIFSAVPFKLIILDEADQMTTEAQAALRRVIEKFTRNVRFCIICNQVNKISSAVQSRCTRFRFGPLKKAQVMQRLQYIVQQEEIEYTEEGLNAVHKLSGGDMRKCLNIMQATSNSFKCIKEDEVYNCTGQPSPKDVRSIVECMVGNNLGDALRQVLAIKNEKGLYISDILAELCPYVQRMAFSDEVKIFLLEKLSEIEYHLAFSTSEKLQISAMVGVFQIAKQATADDVPISQLTRGGV
uniref:AAA+ ATPase domain-containing protein n=1 Tax=Eutreptiella gymnastica TaxID=73025 RepID=A0A6U7XZ77_9EUGL